MAIIATMSDASFFLRTHLKVSKIIGVPPTIKVKSIDPR